MFAVLESGSKQYFVRKNSVFNVEFMRKSSVGENVVFNRLLFLDDGNNSYLDKKELENAQIFCEVIEHFRSKKVIVFKKKRRKNYRRKFGHRQFMTKLRVIDISLSGSRESE